MNYRAVCKDLVLLLKLVATKVGLNTGSSSIAPWVY